MPLVFQVDVDRIVTSPYGYWQISLSFAAVSVATSIMASQSVGICGMSDRLVRFSHWMSLRPGADRRPPPSAGPHR